MNTTTFEEDTENEFRWATVETERDAFGVIQSRQTTNDNGTTAHEAFLNGFLQTYTGLDRAPDGGPSAVMPWDTVVENYIPLADGDLLDYFALMDDGTVETHTYVGGAAVTIRLTDFGPKGAVSAVKPWHVKETRYDLDGNIDGYFEVLDNGTAQEHIFALGNLVRILRTDDGFGEDPSGAKPWHRIDTTYDREGRPLLRVVERDDGVRTTSRFEAITFEDSVLVSIDRRDLNDDGGTGSAMPWTSAFTHFSADGEIVQRVIDWDTSARTTQTFEEGVLRNTVRLDAPETAGLSDTFVWERIETDYDATGQRIAKEIVFDTGVVMTNSFEDGVLRNSVQSDHGGSGAAHGVKPWETMMTRYDALGRMERRETTFDNGDLVVILFAQGERTARLQVDGDGSNQWAARETLFDTDGQAAQINLYDGLGSFQKDYGFAVPL